MVYTSGIISDPEREETLEEMQDNKMAVICEKIQLQENESLLDIGCGWGTLVNFASQNFKARATGITLGRNQTAWGNSILRKSGIPEDQSKILCMDYRDIPVPEGGFDKITCVEMAEHVGIRHFTGFLSQCFNMLDDDGIMYMQLAGLRKSWQYEDLNWGIFMNKYIFPGADASTPLSFYISSMEAAGFEVKSIDTVGVHYSATLWRWYRNWMGNRDKVEAKYGKRWFRVSHFPSLFAEENKTKKRNKILTAVSDLGVLPGVVGHYCPPGWCYLLPDYSGQKPELQPQSRWHSLAVGSAGRHCQQPGQHCRLGCPHEPDPQLPGCPGLNGWLLRSGY